MSRKPQLSVVIPAYNEAERLPSTLQRIRAYIDERRLDAELIVVDDGSSDNTADLAAGAIDGIGQVIRNSENRGKGAAVRDGFHAANGRWVLMSDADLSTPIEEYEKLSAIARDHDLDIVIGSRGLSDSQVEIRQFWLRQFMGKTFNVMIRGLTDLPFKDTQCGFKLMDRDRLKPIFDKMVVDRFAFDVEMLFLAHRMGLAIQEVPVVWRNEPNSKVNMVVDPPNMLAEVARVRWRFRRGDYHPS